MDPHLTDDLARLNRWQDAIAAMNPPPDTDEQEPSR
ncbi:hypothetical protein HD595_006704 [Nonomuraea roseoviolacea subsp. carminata]|uniref:Uncharacterized protein n=1 Tax=Nonomuraea roseoviolacea subsp. carminata TaxID=160689 RepID=A0ABT1K986_9ACTN|nr:hypothetical protein [Nonomuraea roseoviolacea subsp. carminata]